MLCHHTPFLGVSAKKLSQATSAKQLLRPMYFHKGDSFSVMAPRGFGSVMFCYAFRELGFEMPSSLNILTRDHMYQLFYRKVCVASIWSCLAVQEKWCSLPLIPHLQGGAQRSAPNHGLSQSRVVQLGCAMIKHDQADLTSSVFMVFMMLYDDLWSLCGRTTIGRLSHFRGQSAHMAYSTSSRFQRERLLTNYAQFLGQLVPCCGQHGPTLWIQSRSMQDGSFIV